MELIEFVPGSIYFVSSRAVPGTTPSSQMQQPLRMAYIHVEKEFPYQNFYLDFGPLHLAHIVAFARALNDRLVAVWNDQEVSNEDNQRDVDVISADNARVCVYTSMVPQYRVNAVCLLGCWAILFKKWTADRAFAPFKHLSLPSFHDASPNIDSFGLGVLDVLHGLERAVNCGLFPSNVEEFNDAAFLDDMDPDKRDLTWITPHIAAFAGPQSHPSWFGRLKADDYIEYFQSRGVTLVVRLNTPKYDKRIFTEVGIEDVDLYFPDGTCPSETIVAKFLALLASKEHTKVAIHCKAGLGRTGTLIACALMLNHQFSAEEAIAWLRLCRPGSVIGTQQHFLREIQPRLAKIAHTSGKTIEDPASVGPEDVSVVIDEDREQNFKPVPTKGIAARMKSTTSQPTTASIHPPALKALPPKIPGRHATSAATSVVAPIPHHATQGDLLLLRKHAPQFQMPLATNLWSSPTRDLIQ